MAAAQGFRSFHVASTLLARLVVLPAGAVSAIGTARALGPAGRGHYLAIVTAASLVAQTLNLGLSSSNVLLGARDRAALWPLLMNSVWLTLASAALGAGLIAAGGDALSRVLAVPPAM